MAVIGKPATEVFPMIKEAIPELFLIYGRVSLTGTPESFEIYFKLLAKWLHISVYAPAKEHFVAVFEDISEHKRVEGALQKSEKRYSAITEQAADAVIMHDRMGRTLVDTASGEVTLGQVVVKNDLPAGAEVFADPLIAKVCNNLVDNAVRHGGKNTTLWFSIEGREGDYIIVCEDDGCGVMADEKEKIFERGFGKNTGLGLFLSREILAITDITITENGTPGKGARFEMTVPKGMWRKNEVNQ